MKRFKIITLIISILLLPYVAAAQNISDYLILQDIGPCKLSTPVKYLPGEPPTGGPRVDDSSGVLKSADHFPDHTDRSYEVMYLGGGVNPSPKVEVTQHAGGDSDRWLLHEIEDSFRSSKIERLGLLIKGSRVVEINGNKIIARTGYRWVSNNVVVDISYTDLDGNKSEPLEIVQAYLAKFPSTITATDAVFKSNDYNVKWIKDEMDRRLWLCDKWNAQYQAGQAKQKDLIDELADNMEDFLNYQQKYYGVTADADLEALFNYKQKNDLVSIQTKLTEYKTWWNANKTKAITLP
jgi:hypothetical protein